MSPDDRHPPPLDAVVLAGGAARRFGADKIVHQHDGARLVEHVVREARLLEGRVLVATGKRSLQVPDTTEVPDAPGIDGPLAGVVAGLEAASTPHVGILAGDLLAPSAALLRALQHHVTASSLVGAMPVVDDRPQPLHAVVATAAADVLKAAALHQPRVLTVYDQLGIVPVPEDHWRAWTPNAHPQLDVDHPSDISD